MGLFSISCSHALSLFQSQTFGLKIIIKTRVSLNFEINLKILYGNVCLQFFYMFYTYISATKSLKNIHPVLPRFDFIAVLVNLVIN